MIIFSKHVGDHKIIQDSLSKLLIHIERSNYKGFDPYDALKSPLFRLPILESNKLIRFGAQQLVKRLPFNIRPFLGIHKGYNPVTLGLCLQGYIYLFKKFGCLISDSGLNISPSPPLIFSQSHLEERIQHLVAELKLLVSPGHHGACWGYDFPWEARYASIPAYQPTVVATGIITNALYAVHKITGNKECVGLVKDSADFVMHDLNKTYSGDSFIFSYSPFDNQQVFNASMKGVRILSQAYTLNGDENLKINAKKAVEFVVSNQHKDGSWGYSLASGGGWSDNYHTGYILDCLHEYGIITGDHEYDDALRAGYEYYLAHFIEETGMPRYYHDKPFPADCTSGAQTILTFARFGNIELATRVAKWMIENMQSPSGAFYFRKYQHYTNRTVFMRWSNAWMFVALACLLSLDVD